MALVARRSGRRRRMMAEINVVPYVDVMLVLVVILMVAAPFVNPSVVNLPSVAKAGQQKETPVVVEVKRSGDTTVVFGGTRISVSGKAELQRAVEKFRGNRDLPVVVAGDREVKYERVMSVVSDLQEAKISRVSLYANLK
jgi:biopolymer transport protein TolR